MKLSTRATETIWLTSSLGFLIGVTAAGWVGYIMAVLWAGFIVHCSQCLYRAGRTDGQREGYEAGKEDGRAAMLKEIQDEAARQLKEAMDTEAAIWKAVGERIQESLKTQTMVVRNPDYGTKN